MSYTTPAPAHGALSGTSPQLTYTPSDGFTGTDSFDYTVQDAEGAAATAVVTITVIDAGPSVDSRTDEPRGERAIQSRWESLGGTSGVLGSPRGEVHGVAGGFARDFERGVIFWSRATGAHVVLGAILARYRRLGGAGSGLGLPVGEERDAAVSGSRVSVFQHGVVFWSRATGAHVVLGAILARYRRLGGAGSALGLPTTDEYPVREGAKQRFQSGSLLWDRSERRTYSPRQNKIHRAVEIAKNQKGDPYRYGATGPHRFDCSGLIYYSFRKAGLRMPRTTGAQARHGRRIARGDMRKGDLMVFHSGGDVYHDGIFVGWNSDHERLVLHAPYSGQVVRTVPVWTQQWYPVTVR